jgi:hypothetical protein
MSVFPWEPKSQINVNTFIPRLLLTERDVGLIRAFGRFHTEVNPTVHASLERHGSLFGEKSVRIIDA